MLQLEYPQVLLLIPILLVLIWVLLRQKTHIGYSSFGLLEGAVTLPLNIIQKIVLCVAVALVVITIASPYHQTTSRVLVNREARELLILLDKSGSMITPVAMSKLDTAKSVVKEFVERRSGDRIALISFALRPQLEWPPSFAEESSGYHDPIIRKLDKLKSAGATDIPKALLFTLEISELTGKANSRAIILVSDGISTIDPDEHEEIVAKANGIGCRIYWIWIQEVSKEMAPGGAVTLQHYEAGFARAVRILAEATGGRAFKPSVSDLAAAFSEIEKLEPSLVAFEEKPRKVYHFVPFLLGALIAFMLVLSIELVKEKEV